MLGTNSLMVVVSIVVVVIGSEVVGVSSDVTDVLLRNGHVPCTWTVN